MPEFANQLRWQTDLRNSPGGGAPGYVIYDDLLIIAVGSAVFGLDRYTGQQRFKYLPSNPTFDPRTLTVFGGQIIASDDKNDSTLYVINMKDGTTKRFIGVQGYVTGMIPFGRSLFTISQAGVYEVGFSQRRWQILNTAYIPSRAPAAYDDDNQLLYLPTQSSSLDALTLPALSTRWSIGLDGQVNFTPALDDNAVYVGTERRTVYAIDKMSGHINWQSAQLPADLAANVSVGDTDASSVYAPLSNKLIYPLEKATGKIGDPLRVDESISASIMVNPLDEILYIPASGSIYAYAPDTGNELKYSVGGWAYLLGTNGSDIYAGGDTKIYAINFTEALKQFTIESHLMQDFEPTTAPVAQGSGLNRVPYYNTEVFLHKPDKTALANITVQVWSTEDTAVKINGQSVSLTRAAKTNIQTDPGGRIRIESRAQGISTPGILINAPFLDSNEAIVIYPDQGVHQKLASVTGDKLAEAQDYEKKPILTPQYQSDETARNNAGDAIAAALGMTMSGGQQNPPPRAKRGLGAPSDYDEAVNVGVFLITDPSQLTRPLALAENWQLNLGSSGGSQFRRGLSDADVNQQVGQMQKRSDDYTGKSRRSFTGDLWDALENGSAKVISAVVYVADQVTKAIKTTATVLINGIEYFFKDVLMAGIEHALLLVKGILNEIVEDFQKALEWLSFVFDWDAILQKHDEVKTTVLDALESLKQPVIQGKTLLEFAGQSIDTLMTTLKDQVDDSFNQLRSGIGQDSFNSHRAKDKETLPGGSKSSWLTNKVTQNTSDGSSNQPRAVGSGDSGVSVTITDDLIAALSRMVESIKNDLTNDVYNTFNQLLTGFQNMSASDFLAGSLAAVLTIFQGVIDLSIDLGKNLIMGLFDILNVLIKDDIFKNLLTAELPIPFVKDLYHYLTGSTMSVLDLTALLIAIPASIVERAASGDPAKRTLVPRDKISAPILMATVSFAIWAGVDVWIEWTDAFTEEGEQPLLAPPSKDDQIILTIKTVSGIAIPAIIQFLLAVDVIKNAISDPESAIYNGVLWGLASMPILCDFLVATCTPKHLLARFEIAGQVIQLIIGLAYYTAFGAFLGIYEKFREDVCSVLFNAFPMGFTLIKWTRNLAYPTPNTGRLFVASADAVMNVATAGVGLFLVAGFEGC